MGMAGVRVSRPANCASVTSFRARRIEHADALPGTANGAGVLDVAMPAAGGALGERYRAFQGVQDRGRADAFRVARQLVAAVGTAGRIHQARAVQLLQQFGHRGRRNVRAFRQSTGVQQACAVRSQVGQDERGVVRQFSDPQHVAPLFRASLDVGPF